MQIAPFNYIKRSKHFDPSKWPLSSSTTISPQADLMVHLPQIREDHVKYISELARYSNEVGFFIFFFFFSEFTEEKLYGVNNLFTGNDNVQRS